MTVYQLIDRLQQYCFENGLADDKVIIAIDQEGNDFHEVEEVSTVRFHKESHEAYGVDDEDAPRNLPLALCLWP